MAPTMNDDNSISIRPPAKIVEKYERPPIRPPERLHPQTQDQPTK
ncbi:8218_t:CDS:1, partial [Ambispora leptoticha]